MGHILKNANLEIQIDLPHENYNFSRFDWTGKIVSVLYKNVQLAGVEDLNCTKKNLLGRGFFNEFGIDSALGFDETETADWFHKIGVGLLKKVGKHYEFNTSYKIKPAEFQTSTSTNRVLISCIASLVNNYSYELHKTIELQETGFTISYYLKNTGKKAIRTDEYVHNFTTINGDSLGKNYTLNFPFELKPELFGEHVNPALAVRIREKGIRFNSSPNEPFFFSNLSGGKNVPASWELLHLKSKIGIREKASFQTNKINLWGSKHVISPELFFDIFVAPNKSMEWTRTYEIFDF
ncbi:MAG: hypothetical protein ABJN95_09380 [Maribacter sp.]|uniref:hypothetical protein n=1 Tax=Maribacter sp. TaxID=1897614 RepID=UPI00329884D3